MVDEQKSASPIGKYEITFILEENSKPESVLKIFVKEGIEQTELRDLGMKRFAYKIGKLEAGRYFALVFLTETSKLRDLERDLRLEKDIVRHLIVKVEHEKMKALHEQKQAARNMKKAAAAMEEKKVSEQPKDNRHPAKAPIGKTAEAPVKTAVEKSVEKTKETATVPIADKPLPEERVEEKEPIRTVKKVVAKAPTSKAVGAPTKSVGEKPKEVKKPKSEKITKKELDKKLEELVED